MNISPEIFQAYLKCPTKCWLRAVGEPATGNTYAEWVKTQDDTYRVNETARLTGELPNDEVAASPEPETLQSAKWLIATNVPVLAQVNSCSAQSCLHAVERVPAEGRGKPARFIPIRFIYRNKLTKDDKLLLTFDAFVLSETLGREVSLGKIIHGDVRSCARESAAISQAPTTEVPSEPTSAAFSRTQPQVLKVKTSALAAEVRKRLEKIAALLANEKPPDLVLNRHCAECEFRDRCRKLAVEKDDLSLLAGMSAKERQKLRSKGIFTVTQLSYTFRPRRRPRRLRDKREKYHHSLKALAIREQKIHIVGSPELKIEGTPVYLDVEGLPDRDFYYLIGLRIGDGESAVQHSLWAGTVADEGKIWREFFTILETVEKPVLIHYGSYETEFLKQMRQLHAEPPSESGAAKAVQSGVNLLSHIFAQIYFPTFSNGLKEAARFIGFDWLDPRASGTQAISWRQEWEQTGQSSAKSALLAYNAEDCTALQRLVEFLSCLHSNGNGKTTNDNGKGVVKADDLPREGFGYFGPNRFQFPELEEINKAAYWDYQRERVLVKTCKRRQPQERKHANRSVLKANKLVIWPAPPACPKCGEEKIYKHVPDDKTVFDLRFSKSGVKRWVTRFDFYRYRCTRCKAVLHNPDRVWSREKFGWNLCAFVAYQVVELRLPQETVTSLLNRLFGFDFCRGIMHRLKVAAAEFYQATYNSLLKRIIAGSLVHADETAVDFKGGRGYVWAFTNLDEVAFVFAESREGDTVQSVLGNFKGVLVSDFYAAYDSIDCPQQKCLIHLIRDLNDDLMAEPFNEELKKLIADFTYLVRPMIATVDRYGLKTRFLRKHKAAVEEFYVALSGLGLQSATAQKCKTRLEKNQDSLFTFLDYDGVPWNNNNAEHAIKSFALLRRVFTGVTTEKGIREYLVLLSVCQTCKYMGVDFLDFLRSGEKDIHAFAESRRRRRKVSVHSESAASVSGTPPSGSRTEGRGCVRENAADFSSAGT